MDERSDGFWILVVGIVCVLIWIPHLYYAIRLWRRRRSARTFRNAFIAIMLMVGLSRGVLAGAARIWPATEWVQVLNRGAAPIIFLLLITGAVVAFITWRSDNAAHLYD